ncbi:hypothetical protein ACIPSE_21460 [Streptomyces sp. NPDC090106]|uniref:hypothetical protein n=1 Tax=Streptomyces sp. NPDC090106 TaxID=3365946 RepID=UPI0038282C94
MADTADTPPPPPPPSRLSAGAVTGMVEHPLTLDGTWTRWDGRPITTAPIATAPIATAPIATVLITTADGRAYTPHKAIRRVADHLVDHLVDHPAEPEARLAGDDPRPDHRHASAVTTEADLAPFTPADVDEARSRVTRRARNGANGLDARGARPLDASSDQCWTHRQLALHLLAESTYHADAVGDPTRTTGQADRAAATS